ncbi:hypothetical protein DEH81_19015 [Pectobacterium zantedeschiae]|uniref:Uncharacterized protein n=1 Tax=Pectobacterium zantedeschiae TaxID=2034769 RepID=A0A9X8JF70_9GAMM|nr:hypothetical protein DEH81_19015 [Pectobacterium zantedeschiae]RYC39872.1 hypothetical protein CLR69_19100 [Pectobacterium zantedeschiae]
MLYYEFLYPTASARLPYSSYFKLHVRWLRSLTRITYLCKLIGTPSLAAFLKLELFRVYLDLRHPNFRPF